MSRRRRIALIAAVLTLGTAASAQAAIEPCGKNHYILEEPCALDWTRVNSGLTDLDVRVLTLDPVTKTTLYAGGPSGLFKSIDGGGSWSMTGLSMGPRTSADTAAAFQIFRDLPHSFVAASVVAHLAVDSVNPSTLYAATNPAAGCTYLQRRIFKSSDGGASWTDSVGPAINGCDGIYSLALAPSDPATMYLASLDAMVEGSSLVRTADGAATWTYLAPPFINVLAVDPLDSRTVYAGTFDFDLEPYYVATVPNGVLKSTDGGATWAATGLTGQGITALAVDPANPHTLYAAGHGEIDSGRPSAFRGVFKSADGGASWVAVNNGLASFIGTPTHVAALVVDSDDSNTIYVAMPGVGILRSIDAGASWTAFNDGLQNPFVQALALVEGNPNTLYAGTPSGVFKITDDLPVLSIDAPRLCVGAPWTVQLRKGLPAASARLYGTRNGQPWEGAWRVTDASGRFSESGTFATEGSHTLRVQVGGTLSNSVSFAVASCQS